MRRLLRQSSDATGWQVHWDLQSLYADKLEVAQRSIRCGTDGHVLIQTSVGPADAGQAGCRIRWNWVTEAACSVLSDTVLQLSHNYASVFRAACTAWSRWTYFASEPERSCERANPGLSVVGFEFVCDRACTVQVCFASDPQRFSFIE